MLGPERGSSPRAVHSLNHGSSSLCYIVYQIGLVQKIKIYCVVISFSGNKDVKQNKTKKLTLPENMVTILSLIFLSRTHDFTLAVIYNPHKKTVFPKRMLVFCH